MVFLCCIINAVSSNEYLEPSALAIRVLQVPVVRFYKASLSKPAAFIPLMHPPHYLFTPSSSPIMKDFDMRRWVCFDHTLSAAPTPTLTPQVPVQSWFDDMADTELLDLIPLLEGLSKEEDVYSQLQGLRSR